MHDEGFKARERERFERLFKHHRTVMLDNGRHHIQEDAHDRIVDEIRTFIR
ncbi:MAG TPA: hypothetical protein VEY30_03460 [Myxococcaceae bacterium]|nr:hypothetical protein [Myxococcaceae bacterium]